MPPVMTDTVELMEAMAWSQIGVGNCGPLVTLPSSLTISELCNFFALKVPFFRKLNGAQKNMPNHYLKLEFLKLHFVCFCFAADFQANPTDISSKKSGKIHTTSLR